MLASLKFCGRKLQLDQLIALWRLATDIEKPHPQIVVITAERGIGKTRLALEFYRWLSEHVDAAGGSGYWPDTTAVVGRNLEVNPDARKCNFEVKIPYLWWGLRAGDPGAPNGVAGDAIATYDMYLLPHLAALLVRARMHGRAWEVSKAWGEVGLDLISGVLQLDKIASVCKAVLKTAELACGISTNAARTQALENSFARSIAVFEDLERAFAPGTATYARTPGVVFVDDAQFAHKDAALPAFLERLMNAAVMQRWPMLIIVSHWKGDVLSELMPNTPTFTHILEHARTGSSVVGGLGANLPGGYLSDDSLVEINLQAVDDLSPALREKLPGLTETQSEAILTPIGGNPRFLEQVTEYLLEHKSFFENYDASGPLTSNGLNETLKAARSREIFELVLRRLQDAPEDVQETICLASLQGVRFANDLVEELSRKYLGRSARESLRQAEDPYSMLIGTKHFEEGVGQFAERLFYEVAQQQRLELKSLGGEPAMQLNFQQTVAALVNDPKYSESASANSLALIYGTAANLFQGSPDPNERQLTQRCLGELAGLELSRYSFESAAAAFERLLAIKPVSGNASERVSRIETWDRLAIIYQGLRWPAKAARALKQIFWEAIRHIPDGTNIFIQGVDKHAAQECFDRWKREHPDVPPDAYVWVVRKIVLALLNLSELALARPELKISDGDDPLCDAPLLVRVEPRVQDVSEAEEPSVPEHVLQAMFLRERAYAQKGVLGEGEVEGEHFKLLERLSRWAFRDGDLSAAKGIVSRALQIAEDSGEVLNQVVALNNLGMIAGMRDESATSESYLEQALSRVEAILAEETFAVDLVSDKVAPNGEIAESRKVGRIDIPLRLSQKFDEDPNGVVHQVWTLKQTAANIYGNLARNALENRRLAEANKGFSRAISMRQEISDKENLPTDLGNLAEVAKAEGNMKLACSYWSQCLVILRELQRRDAGELVERTWNKAIEATQKLMLEGGCSHVESGVD